MVDDAPAAIVKPFLRVRQVREFTDQPVDDDHLVALTDVARWSGSSSNAQPWRFIVVRDADALGAIGQSGLPVTRALSNAPAAIAIVVPQESGKNLSHAYDEGRAAERILIAASFLKLGAGIVWILERSREVAHERLGIPDGHIVRTMVAIGHPSEAGRRRKSAPGEARLPRSETVFEERWPGG